MSSQQTTYGIIGNPLSHSLSPLMHNAAFQALGIDAIYKVFPLEENELKGFIDDFRSEKNLRRGLHVSDSEFRPCSRLDGSKSRWIAGCRNDRPVFTRGCHRDRLGYSRGHRCTADSDDYLFDGTMQFGRSSGSLGQRT